LELHPETTAVYLETPANPTMALIDIAATAEIAHAAGAKVIVDNTFATPILQRPLSLGADVVVHSTTKFINGHGTVIGGAVVSADEALMVEEIGSLIRFTGGVPSPFDCWLTSLGLKTLPLRMRQHCSNGQVVAEFLDDHPAVEATSYPGLERLELCTLAVSLGNVDTLIEHPASMTHAVVPPDERAASGITEGLIRISVGLEDASDIIGDLEQALES
jgi:methionine-gamma-lyase